MYQGVVFSKGVSGQWDAIQVGNPTLLEKADGTCYLYYAGVGSGGTQGGLAIV